jgi:4-hydroxybenzoate polyprenyltransferase
MNDYSTNPVLAVDLDGTLMRGDLSGESLLAYLRGNPLRVFEVIQWARVGRAHVKRQLAERVEIDYSKLAYQQEVLDFVAAEQQAGRRTCLATGSDEILVQPLADHVGCFDDVIASDGQVNKTGRDKVAALDAAYGPGNYSYVGNSSVDFRVWPDCQQVYVASASEKFTQQVRSQFKIDKLFQYHGDSPATWLRQMRVYQWLKNLLLFVPLLVGHAYGEAGAVASSIVAFLSFSLCASAIYVLNDLADLPYDRAHSRKRRRPLANGDMQILVAILLVPVLLFGSLVLSLFLPAEFQAVLLLYALTTISYSARLKRIPIVDVLVLGGLYTLRIIAGGVALGIPLSFWLLAFSMFLFLSLALMKRYTELREIEQGAANSGGRGYQAGDSGFVFGLGAAAAYSSVMVLALYINSEVVLQYYQTKQALWLLCPVVLFWVSHMWFSAYRDRMHDDPILFAVRDPISLLCAAAMAVCFVVAI